ncbi:flagellar hook-basal body protein [Sporosarcina gallistercoris]|uniref:Flagellar hook-basal body protein n=1 Tax=Sporosarcina gallistercoris TaxID=2762245 RepID=A0ABR8PLW0_9BACL|nr:flagellar hook-basal body protein [Sporosarcina gallistercoris]MBD7909156.1 flagellar hook-basal body protein [Sporosarcina gallistercoris]
MFRGFYTAGSGMIAQQRRTELLSNNMANANTPGFKTDQSSIRSFPEMFLSNLEAAKVPVQNSFQMKGLDPIGALSTGTYMQETMPLFTQGQLRETELTTDIALVDGVLPVNPETGNRGAVFYTLEGSDGERAYTKNGNFALNPEGYLTTPSGNYVLDADGQRIQLPNDDFQVTEDGIIKYGEQVAAALGISYAVNPETLVKRDNGLFYALEELPDANDAQGVSYSFKQGFVEQSNVDTSRTMTDMMTAYRAFEANQKVLQAYDRSMEKAVSEIGRVNG